MICRLRKHICKHVRARSEKFQKPNHINAWTALIAFSTGREMAHAYVVHLQQFSVSQLRFAFCALTWNGTPRKYHVNMNCIEWKWSKRWIWHCCSAFYWIWQSHNDDPSLRGWVRLGGTWIFPDFPPRKICMYFYSSKAFPLTLRYCLTFFLLLQSCGHEIFCFLITKYQRIFGRVRTDYNMCGVFGFSVSI